MFTEAEKPASPLVKPDDIYPHYITHYWTRLLQVEHGSRVWVVGRAEPGSYDAMVTDRAGVVLAAPGADCMPILFADPRSKVIGAAHAGDSLVCLQGISNILY